MRCPDCKGKGRIPLFVSYEDPCCTCGGSGEVPDVSDSEVDLEAKCVQAQQQACDDVASDYDSWVNSSWPPWPFGAD